MEFINFAITIPAKNIGLEEVTVSLPRVEMREEDIIKLCVRRTSNFMLYEDEEALCVTRISKLQLGYFIMALEELTKHEIIYYMDKYKEDKTVVIEIYDTYRE
jgi:hypothetical protein